MIMIIMMMTVDYADDYDYLSAICNAIFPFDLQYDDWRLNESLNEASRAASNMQTASRRMLNNLASDLIRSGYSEY